MKMIVAIMNTSFINSAIIMYILLSLVKNVSYNDPFNWNAKKAINIRNMSKREIWIASWFL